MSPEVNMKAENTATKANRRQLFLSSIPTGPKENKWLRKWYGFEEALRELIFSLLLLLGLG